MGRKFHKDVTRDREIYKISDDIHSSVLGEYYFIMTEEMMLAGHSQQYHFDEDGIPIIPTYIDIEEQRLLYYPISIGQYGLAIWHTFLKTNSTKDRDRFLKIADWFVENAIIDNKLGAYWLTDVDKPAYRIKRPWKSAFSQARAINICMRAYQITGKKKYDTTSELALQPFLFSIEEGGVTANIPEGPFYEEYPSTVPVLVLNGKIFALCGIYDFMRTHSGHAIAEKIFIEGVRTLKLILPKFDIGYWSKYSLCEADFHPKIDPATIGYHFLHIIQLKLMRQMTGQHIFQNYAQKWERVVNYKNILKMYITKYFALRKMNRL